MMRAYKSKHVVQKTFQDMVDCQLENAACAMLIEIAKTWSQERIDMLVKLKDDSGRDLCHHAIVKNCRKVLEFLLEMGAKPFYDNQFMDDVVCEVKVKMIKDIVWTKIGGREKVGMIRSFL